MPLEIHRSKPIIGPDQEFFSTAPQVNPYAPRPKCSRPRSLERGGTAPLVNFRFQHDVESLWWVALWILLYRVGGVEALKLTARIFTNTDTPSKARENFFTEKGDGLKDYIHEELKPLIHPILDIRATLYNSYNNKEKSENIMDPTQYRQIYVDVWARLSELIQDAVNIEGVSFQDPKRAEQNTKKRPHSKLEPGDDDEYTPHIPRIKRK